MQNSTIMDVYVRSTFWGIKLTIPFLGAVWSMVKERLRRYFPEVIDNDQNQGFRNFCRDVKECKRHYYWNGDVPKGFPNLGNTCYMNSTLQVLCWTPLMGQMMAEQLWKSIEEGNEDIMKSVLGRLFLLLRNVQSENRERRGAVERELLVNIKQEAKHLNGQFEGFRQQDSFEMFNTLIGGIEDGARLLPCKNVKREKRTDNEILMDQSNVSRLLTGTFITVWYYDSCQHVELSFQRFTSVSVPVPRPKPKPSRCNKEDRSPHETCNPADDKPNGNPKKRGNRRRSKGKKAKRDKKKQNGTENPGIRESSDTNATLPSAVKHTSNDTGTSPGGSDATVFSAGHADSSPPGPKRAHGEPESYDASIIFHQQHEATSNENNNKTYMYIENEVSARTTGNPKGQSNAQSDDVKSAETIEGLEQNDVPSDIGMPSETTEVLSNSQNNEPSGDKKSPQTTEIHSDRQSDEPSGARKSPQTTEDLLNKQNDAQSDVGKSAETTNGLSKEQNDAPYNGRKPGETIEGLSKSQNYEQSGDKELHDRTLTADLTNEQNYASSDSGKSAETTDSLSKQNADPSNGVRSAETTDSLSTQNAAPSDGVKSAETTDSLSKQNAALSNGVKSAKTTESLEQHDPPSDVRMPSETTGCISKSQNNEPSGDKKSHKTTFTTVPLNEQNSALSDIGNYAVTTDGLLRGHCDTTSVTEKSAEITEGFLNNQTNEPIKDNFNRQSDEPSGDKKSPETTEGLSNEQNAALSVSEKSAESTSGIEQNDALSNVGTSTVTTESHSKSQNNKPLGDEKSPETTKDLLHEQNDTSSNDVKLAVTAESLEQHDAPSDVEMSAETAETTEGLSNSLFDSGSSAETTDGLLHGHCDKQPVTGKSAEINEGLSKSQNDEPFGDMKSHDTILIVDLSNEQIIAPSDNRKSAETTDDCSTNQSNKPSDNKKSPQTTEDHSNRQSDEPSGDKKTPETTEGLSSNEHNDEPYDDRSSEIKEDFSNVHDRVKYDVDKSSKTTVPTVPSKEHTDTILADTSNRPGFSDQQDDVHSDFDEPSDTKEDISVFHEQCGTKSDNMTTSLETPPSTEEIDEHDEDDQFKNQLKTKILEHEPLGKMRDDPTDLERGFLELTEEELWDEELIGCRICDSSYKEGKKKTHKKLLIIGLPPILVIHINKIERDENGGLRKLNETVTYPKYMDVAPFCSSALRGIEEVNTIPGTWYRLYGVVSHSGSIHGGHYIAYVRTSPKNASALHNNFMQRDWTDPESLQEDIKKFWQDHSYHTTQSSPDATPPRDVREEKWFNVSDSVVQPCNERETTNDRNAYILMYERCCA